MLRPAGAESASDPSARLAMTGAIGADVSIVRRQIVASETTRSFLHAAALLFGSIDAILFDRAKPHMLNVVAWWRIAFMANNQPFRNRAACSLPNQAMRAPGMTVGRCLPVALVAATAGIQQAAIGTWNAPVEDALGNELDTSLPRHVLSNVPIIAGFEIYASSSTHVHLTGQKCCCPLGHRRGRYNVSSL